MATVTIVSNRLPVSVKRVGTNLEFYPSVGGLATGLASYASGDKHNRWIGWPGIAADELTNKEKQFITTELRKQHCLPVFLTQKQIDNFYNGYSNSLLWPLFHNLPIKAKERTAWWKAYQEVNELFAETVLAHGRPHSSIWVHDYQLMLVPQLLRAQWPQSRVGFFLHIPFPTAAAFETLAQAKQLIAGMLGSDLVGFHTVAYVENFLQSCSALQVGVAGHKQVMIANRAVKVTEFPMGIDYVKFSAAGKTRAVQRQTQRYRWKYRRRKIILTVDRLDPTKGLKERLEAYRTFLEMNPEFHQRVVMIMLATPSRTEIAEYKTLRKQVESLVANINSTFGKRRWQPVEYRYESLPFEHVASLYKIADVAFIAPIRDGMNLVAKEYVAGHGSKDGALILSTTAGAADELTDAILVNPRRRASLVDGLLRAVTMPHKELHERMVKMQQHTATHTVHQWVHSFLDSLEEPELGGWKRTETLDEIRQLLLIDSYNHAKKRLLLLDYDGTLATYHQDPKQAKPTGEVLQLLKRLSKSKANDIIMLSGRSRTDLETWFGALPLTLAAEHGALVREAGKRTWKDSGTPSTNWKKILLPVLQKYAAKTPGAFVEQKEASLVWHFRKSSPYIAQKNIVAMKHELKLLLLAHGLVALNGNKIVEIKSPAVNKGTVLSNWLDKPYDFILALGDDLTDEDTFTALPSNAYSVKVGRGRTNARFRLPDVKSVIDLLDELSN